MIDITAMQHFAQTNEDFKTYIEKNMQTYNRTLSEELQSPITQNYYEALQAGGCNHRKEQENDV
jgi:hypothetical protein